jgi:diacylglycerol O-acyltransferase/trehalose O-mycolyltransferase
MRRLGAGRPAVAALLAALVLGGAVAAVVLGRDDSPPPGARPATASVFAERRVGQRLLDVNVRSPALGTTAMVRLMTPRGWSRDPGGRTWPVLYLLHGCCDSYESWTRSTDIEDLRALDGTLVIMPEGGPVGFYSNWADGPAWETFHLDELPAILEREYGAGRSRAIAGLSMGGLGAMGYAARRPGFFRAAASFSGLLHPLEDSRLLLGLFSAFTPDALAIWGDPERDLRTWAEHDPTELAGRLRGTELFVSSGDGRPGPLDDRGAERDDTEATVFRESRAFVRRAREHGLAVRTDFYGAGRHDWPYWQRELKRALPNLVEAPRARR